MNILTAFKASNCGRIRRASWKYEDVFNFTNPNTLISPLYVSDMLADDWEPINEPLTFKTIKEKCVAGETLLISESDAEYLYLGFNRNRELITDSSRGGSRSWGEFSVRDWKIGGKFIRGEK